MIKTRLEVLGFNEYKGVIDAAQQIYQKEGCRAFFTGLKVSLIRDVPFSGIWYPTYLWVRAKLFMVYEYEMSAHTNVSPATRVRTLTLISALSSFTANVIACSVTHPVDLIRTRLFFKTFNNDANQHYTGLFNAINKIYS